MKDKRKDGKQKHKNPVNYESNEGPKRRRLKPVSKAKYKINKYQYSEDFEDEEDAWYDDRDED